jgi:hypothetical protein
MGQRGAPSEGTVSHTATTSCKDFYAEFGRTDGDFLVEISGSPRVLYSAICAVQSIWLAARAEGVGVGCAESFAAEPELKTRAGCRRCRCRS